MNSIEFYWRLEWTRQIKKQAIRKFDHTTFYIREGFSQNYILVEATIYTLLMFGVVELNPGPFTTSTPTNEEH